MKTQIITILLIFSCYKCKFPDNKTNVNDTIEVYKAKYLEFETNTELNNLYEKKSKKYAFPNTIRINSKGKLFISVPRHFFGDEIDSYIPSSINCLINNKLHPWPNQNENDFYKGRIHSIVGFEIDLDDNIYLLNHKRNKERELLVYYKNGTIKDIYNLNEVTIHKDHESLLSNIVLDLTYNFAYISDTGKISEKDFKEGQLKNDTKSNLIVLNLKNKAAIRFLTKEQSTLPDINHEKMNENININNLGLYGLALSCDKRFLYYSPIKSTKLYQINTFILQDERTIRNKDINEYDKKYASFEFLSSARGIFYYTTIEENSILVNFYQKLLPFDNLRAIRNGKIFGDKIPISLAFNGTSGYLFYLVNKHHIFINDNFKKELDIQQDNFFIYKIYIHDRSYLYPCNIYSYIPSYYWIAIVIISLVLSYFVYRLIHYVAKLSPKKKEELEPNEEELGYLNENDN